jgi:hypothetical protein
LEILIHRVEGRRPQKLTYKGGIAQQASFSFHFSEGRGLIIIERILAKGEGLVLDVGLRRIQFVHVTL